MRAPSRPLPAGEWLAGGHAVAEAVVAGRRRVEEILVTARLAERDPALVDALRAGGRAPRTVTADELDAAAGTAEHGGVAARVGPYPYVDAAEVLTALTGEAGLVLALDGVQDPHNLGACLRSAEAAGVAAVVIARHRAAEVTPAAVRASAGAAEWTRVARVENLATFLRTARDAGAWTWGAAAEAPLAHSAADLTGPTILVVGAEGRGLRPAVREACDGLVAIPLGGHVDSLNASVAAGVLLFEARRQRISTSTSS